MSLEKSPLLWILQDPVDEELLVDLAVVDLFLDGARRHQPKKRFASFRARDLELETKIARELKR